jgi:AcrR family transcriptional regulator
MSSRNSTVGARKTRPGEVVARRYPDETAGPLPASRDVDVQASTAAALERLRPGRDSLSRDKVDGIQRARILAAMGEVVSERGVGAATVATVVARAGVSRRTFYELFADREECFLAAFDHAIALASAAVLPEYERAGGWRERIRAGLAALLGFLDEEPDLGALCVVHSLGAGPVALERRAGIVDALIAVVDAGRTVPSRGSRKGTPLAPLTAEGVVGAVLAVIHARLAARDKQPMLGLLGSLMNMIVLPYLGAAAANRELSRGPPPRRGRPPPAAGGPARACAAQACSGGPVEGSGYASHLSHGQGADRYRHALGGLQPAGGRRRRHCRSGADIQALAAPHLARFDREHRGRAQQGRSQRLAAHRQGRGSRADDPRRGHAQRAQLTSYP